MIKNIVIVPLEPIESRYTAEWIYHIPNMIRDYMLGEGYELHEPDEGDKGALMGRFVRGADTISVLAYDGYEENTKVTEGAFINFGHTNVWKAQQLEQIARDLSAGALKDETVFYFTDAWNPAIINLRYMIDLLGLNAKIYAQWHAGYHDEHDFLHKAISKRNPRWATNFERSLYEAIDVNFFTTQFYMSMFKNNVGVEMPITADGITIIQGGRAFVTDDKKAMRVGYPLGYLKHLPYAKEENWNKSFDEPLILFPHRIAEEKQVHLHKAVLEELTNRGEKFCSVIAQEIGLSKSGYYKALAEASVVPSYALQETYGIAQVEGLFANAIPIMPNRLSYAEMYSESAFLYNGEGDDNEIVQRMCAKITTNLKGYRNGWLDVSLDQERYNIEKRFFGDDIISKMLVEGV